MPDIVLEDAMTPYEWPEGDADEEEEDEPEIPLTYDNPLYRKFIEKGFLHHSDLLGMAIEVNAWNFVCDAWENGFCEDWVAKMLQYWRNGKVFSHGVEVLFLSQVFQEMVIHDERPAQFVCS